MLDLNHTRSLTSKPVDLSSPAKPDPLDQAITELWSENQKLEGIIQLLCHTEELHLENNGLEGFRNILGGINDAIDKVLEVSKESNHAANAMTQAFELEHKARSIDHDAINAYVKVLRENKEKTVGEVMPEAEAAFNRTITEECKKAGIANEHELTIKDKPAPSIEPSYSVCGRDC